MGKQVGGDMSYIHGLLVHFAKDVHDEDIGLLKVAIGMIKNVTQVEEIPADTKTELAVTRAKLEIREKIWELL